MCAFTQRAREAGMAQSDFGRALAGAERRMERAVQWIVGKAVQV